MADKTPAELLTIVKERVETIHTNLVETTQENLLTTIQQIVAEFGGGNLLLPTDARFEAYGLADLAKSLEAVSVNNGNLEVSNEKRIFKQLLRQISRLPLLSFTS